MKFKVIYIVGKNKRERNIIAKDLEEAEIKANESKMNWIDIYQLKGK